MDMMSSIAATATNMKTAQLQTDYSLAVTKKVMDTQELAAEEMMEMLPAPSKGVSLDVYG